MTILQNNKGGMKKENGKNKKRYTRHTIINNNSER